jgi:hypothetical protein
MSNVRSETHTTTIRLPLPVYEQAKCVVAKERGSTATGTISINDFIVNAIKAYLKMIKRRQIDAAFAGMAEDADYQKEATLLAEEFEHSDWEALRLEEVDLEGETLEYAASSTR